MLFLRRSTRLANLLSILLTVVHELPFSKVNTRVATALWVGARNDRGRQTAIRLRNLQDSLSNQTNQTESNYMFDAIFVVVSIVESTTLGNDRVQLRVGHPYDPL
jgi:hypothetical protein